MQYRIQFQKRKGVSRIPSLAGTAKSKMRFRYKAAGFERRPLPGHDPSSRHSCFFTKKPGITSVTDGKGDLANAPIPGILCLYPSPIAVVSRQIQLVLNSVIGCPLITTRLICARCIRSSINPSLPSSRNQQHQQRQADKIMEQFFTRYRYLRDPPFGHPANPAAGAERSGFPSHGRW